MLYTVSMFLISNAIISISSYFTLPYFAPSVCTFRQRLYQNFPTTNFFLFLLILTKAFPFLFPPFLWCLQRSLWEPQTTAAVLQVPVCVRVRQSLLLLSQSRIFFSFVFSLCVLLYVFFICIYAVCFCNILYFLFVLFHYDNLAVETCCSVI